MTAVLSVALGHLWVGFVAGGACLAAGALGAVRSRRPGRGR